MRYVLSLILTALLGCASSQPLPTPDFNDSAGAANKLVTTLGSAVTAECGNTVPMGECVATSVITTKQKDGIRTQLVTARKDIELAWTLYAAGKPADANDKLAVAQGILNAIRVLLEEKGVK